MADEKPTFTVTTNDASETLIVNNDPPATPAQSKATKQDAPKETL